MKPLILNTRPENRARGTTQRFENAGFRVLELPAIKSVPIEYDDTFFEDLKAVTHLMFSSSQTIHFLKRLAIQDILAMDKKIISIGPKTSQSLTEFGFDVFYESNGTNREHLGMELSKILDEKSRICHLCSHITELQPEEFKKAFEIDIVNKYIYTTVLPEKSKYTLQKYCESSGPFGSDLTEITAVVYYSSSAVRNTFELLKDLNPVVQKKWKHFALGASTYKCLKEYYSTNVYMAQEPSEMSLIQCVKEQRNYE